ncbi:MAG: response regulator [Planctomycetes bacterium]|nr:response regulator [Planctomycetota bacterium]
MPKKVLIVDDEADMRDFAQAALEDDGYQFVFAADGVEAVERAAAEKPDLIVMDVQMPKKDGFAALYDIRRDPALRAIPVILLTGIAEKTGVRFDAGTVKEYMGEQPEAYFDKPVDPDVLREAARKLLAK